MRTITALTLTFLLAAATSAREVRTDPVAGVTHVRQTRTAPGTDRPIQVNALIIDLTTPGLTLDVSPVEPGDPPGRSVSRTVAQFAEREGWVAAISGGPYHRREFPMVDVEGPYVRDGELLVREGDRRSVFCYLDDGRAEIRASPLTDDVRASVPSVDFDGGPETSAILWNGRVQGPEGGLHPRVGVGVDVIGYTVFLVVIDGGRPGQSEGATYHDLARVLKDLGADDAITLNGGNSSTMVVGARAGNVRLVNRPMSRAGTAGAIPVGSALGVRVASSGAVGGASHLEVSGRLMLIGFLLLGVFVTALVLCARGPLPGSSSH